jgi:hypothetical protein
MQPSPRLREFIQRKVDLDGKTTTGIDWKARKILWVSYVTDLYQQIDNILKDLIDEKLVSISQFDVELNEEHIGSYKISGISIDIGDNIVRMIPAGTRIIAATGRVDMKGPQGELMLLLLDKKREISKPSRVVTFTEEQLSRKETESLQLHPGYEWVVANKTVHPREWPVLDENSFLDALKVVLGDVEYDANEE